MEGAVFKEEKAKDSEGGEKGREKGEEKGPDGGEDLGEEEEDNNNALES